MGRLGGGFKEGAAGRKVEQRGTAGKHDLSLWQGKGCAHQTCGRLHATGRTRHDDGVLVLRNAFGDARESKHALGVGVLQASLFQHLRPCVDDDAQEFERVAPMGSAVGGHQVGGQGLFGKHFFQREVLLQVLQRSCERHGCVQRLRARCLIVGL